MLCIHSNMFSLQPIEIKDLGTCARAAVCSRFSNGAVKEFIASVMQHTRLFGICANHSQYVRM